MSLAPCPTCTRHLRLQETACPFCGAATATQLEPTGGKVVLGVSRAMLVFGSVVALSAAASACGEPHATATIYGGPPPAAEDGGAAKPPEPTLKPDASVAPMAPAAAYGAPPSFLPPAPLIAPKKKP